MHLHTGGVDDRDGATVTLVPQVIYDAYICVGVLFIGTISEI